MKKQSYQTVAATLRQRILTGEYVPGAPLPIETDLSREFAVSRITIGRAITELKRDNLIWGRQGKGRFVCDKDKAQYRQTICVIGQKIEDLTHPGCAERINGVNSVLKGYPYTLQLMAANTHDSHLDWTKMFDLRQVRGAIFIAVDEDRKLVEKLAQFMPVVWMDHHRSSPRLDGLCFNYFLGVLKITRHLAELGHQRVGILGVHRSEFEAFQFEIEDGLEAAVRELIPGGSLTCYPVTGFWDVEGAQTIGQRFVAEKFPCTAVVCVSPELTVGFCQGLMAAGGRVPEDVSVVSISNLSILNQLPLPMTALDFRFNEAGAIAVTRLLTMLGHPPLRPAGDMVDPELRIRASTRALHQ